MKPKILVSRKISDGAEEILKKEFDVTLNLDDKPYTYEELIKLSNEYDGLISTSSVSYTHLTLPTILLV